uniref:hypothetical protein n=1 Tax=Psychrobacter sp. TaxID=56811 RepID=UPI001598C6E5|nr:hypothetical protein [Psychrobacter sp.]QJS05186.1 hypothetical protein [Psychrobacter sp.]
MNDKKNIVILDDDQKRIDTEKNNSDANYNELDRLIILLMNKGTWEILFKWCKENLTTSILLISGLGAIIQVLELAKINIAYIRFFSATQLISDGVLVLATVLIIITAYSVFRFIFLSQNIRLYIELRMKDKKLSKDSTDRYAILSFLVPVIFYIFLTGVVFKTFKENFFMNLIGLAFLYTLLTVSFIHTCLYYEYLTSTTEDFKFKKIHISIAKWVRPLNILLTVVSIPALILLCLHVYKLPSNLENYTKVNQQVEKDYRDIDSYEILYFNDTYLFVEIIKGNKKSIAVYETKGVLFDKNVIVNEPS